MGLLDGYRPLLTLLADIDRVMVWRTDATVDLATTSDKALRPRYIDLAKALLPTAQRRTPTSLGQVLSEHAVPGGMDRVVFLKMLAQRLQGQLVPMAGVPALATRLREPRAAIRQWMLGKFSADFRMIVADSRFGRAGRSD